MRSAIERKNIHLSILTALLAGIQSIWLHSNTTDYAHHYFSIYFWIELVILSVILLSGFKGWTTWIIVFGLFSFEVIFFLRNELPFSPDHLLMLVVAVLRLIILVKMAANFRRNSVSGSA